MNTSDNHQCFIDANAGKGWFDSGGPSERLAETHARHRILTNVASPEEIADYAAKYGNATENQKMDDDRAAEYAARQSALSQLGTLKQKYPELFE